MRGKCYHYILALSVHAEGNSETDGDQEVYKLESGESESGDGERAFQMNDVGRAESNLSFIKVSCFCPEIWKY